MNSWFGSREMEIESQGNAKRYRTFVRESEVAVAGASLLWVLADEHEATIDDGCFTVTMDDSRPFGSFPGARHDRAYALNFADSHVELFKLRDTNSLLGPFVPQPASNPDWLRLKLLTTIQ